MGRFQGLASIKTNQGGLYFLEGNYTVDLDEVKFITTRKKEEAFIIGATVVESTNPNRAPGCKPSQVITIKEEILATVMGNIKQFAGAVLEIPDPDSFVADLDPSGFQPGTQNPDTPEAATDRFWDMALETFVSDAQPLKGTRIKLNVSTVPTKTGGVFSKHVWGPVVKMEE